MTTLLDMIKAMLVILAGALFLAIFESVCIFILWIQGCIKRACKGRVKDEPMLADYETILHAYWQISGFADWQEWEQERERER